MKALLLLLALGLPTFAGRAVAQIGSAHSTRSAIAEIEERLSKGFRWHSGRWRLPQEIRYLTRARAAQPDRTGDEGPIDPSWFGAMPIRRAAEARDRLVEAAQRAGDGELELCVVRAWRRDAELRAAVARRVSTAPGSLGAYPVALLGLQIQQTQLLGFDTVPVSFGNGQGRLMLPRTRSISIGTTVAVPLGR
jgi:hypothetical protein